MLIDERAGVVHLVVDYNVEVLLGVVLGNIRVGEFLCVAHSGCCGCELRLGDVEVNSCVSVKSTDE